MKLQTREAKLKEKTNCIDETKPKKSNNTQRDTESPKRYLYGVINYKNFYSIQQGILIALANQIGSISIQKPRKSAKLTNTYPSVKTLHLHFEDVEIMQFTNDFCERLFTEQCNDVNKRQTAVRRFEKNKKVFMQNLLIDILAEKGFFFDSEMARQSKKTFRLERIQRVFYNGDLIINEDEFLMRGKLINDYLCSLFNENSVVTLNQCDEKLMSLLGVEIY